MIELKLDAYIKDGKIEISEEQRKELGVIKDGSPVELTLRANGPNNIKEKSQPRDILQEMEAQGYDSIIDYLLDFPIQIEDVKFLTREEIYSGKRFQ
jgi:hypothetical protein